MSKNPTHPWVIKFKDHDPENKSKANMELVNIFDALHDGSCTNASDFYNARALKEMREDVINSVAVNTSVIEALNEEGLVLDEANVKRIAKSVSSAFLKKVHKRREDDKKNAKKKPSNGK